MGKSVYSKMRLFLVVLSCILILLLQQISALRCYSNNQQAAAQFERILRSCRKKYFDHSAYNFGSSLSESDASEDSSDSDESYSKFFTRNNSRYNTKDFLNAQNNRNGNIKSDRTQSSGYTYGNKTSRNGEDSHIIHPSSNDNYESRNTGWRNQKNTHNIANYQENYNKERSEACIVQCVFNELNVVDNRGFPKEESVIQIMTEKVQDPEMENFIEESIMECFYFLNSNVITDKCEFSQSLLSCLMYKGKERCEDWNM